MVLSQPDNATTPSNRCPRATSSIESAITSRLINEAFIPSVPIEMPSDTAMVLYSMGVPPAVLMPAFTRSDNRRRWKLQGMISIQVLATPMIGRDKSSSVNPTAFNIARAGARLGPTSKSWLVSFSSVGITWLLSLASTSILLTPALRLPRQLLCPGTHLLRYRVFDIRE